MAVCGTPAGYHAHYRRGEEACPECKRAIADDTKQKRLDAAAQAAVDFEDALNNEPEIEPGIDVLRELRHAARITRAAMRVPKSTRDIAALAKQYADLVQQIAALEADLDMGVDEFAGFTDELSARRRPAS